MKKRFLSLFLIVAFLCLLPAASLACPAYPGEVDLTDPDGNTVTVKNHGDEFFSYLTDVDGNLLCRDGDGSFYYVVYDGDAYALGDPVISRKQSGWSLFGRRSGQPGPRAKVNLSGGADGLRKKLGALMDMLRQEETPALFSALPFSLFGASADPGPVQANYFFTADDDPLKDKWRVKSIDVPIPEKEAACPLLVLKIEFEDVKCLFDDGAWHTRIFSPTGGHSVSDYYSTVSNGAFTYVPALEKAGTENDGVITVTLPIDRPLFTNGHTGAEGPYTGQTWDRGVKTGVYTGTDGNKYRIYNNSLLYAYGLAAADGYIDFKQYDRNKDGYISPTELAVLVVAAGYEASMGRYGEKDTSVWACSWIANTWFWDDSRPAGDEVAGEEGAILLDEVRLYKFTVMGENLNMNFDYGQAVSESNKPIQGEIGTACHELGHDLGLQDLYDTSGNPAQKAEVLGLSLMATGSWGQTWDADSQPGSSPTMLDPYSRIRLGFYDADVVTEPGVYPVTEPRNPSAYNILRIHTANPDVYYLVENRTFTGYDAGMFQTLDPPGGAVYWRINEALVRKRYWNNTVNNESGNYGIMPDYIAYEPYPSYIHFPFRSSYTASMQRSFPVETTEKRLFAFDPPESQVMNVWIAPLPMTAYPSASFPVGAAPRNLTVTLDLGLLATLNDLDAVEMDGELLTAPAQYEARSGSIIIAFREAYLNTLSPGVHPVRVTLKNGPYAELPFTVTAQSAASEAGASIPKTGDDALPGLWAGLLLLSAAGLLRHRRKRRERP